MIIGQGATAQPDSIKLVLDSTITLLRTHALHGQRPDWDYVRERAYELAGEATRWEDLGPAISWLFQAVDDHHGWLAAGNTTLRWERAEPPYLSEALKNELAKGGRIVRKMLPGKRTPVVVLTGHGTGSAGEYVAAAFKGRKHTVFIGEPTGGYCTATNGYWIVDRKVRIVIAETRLARNLIPDEWVPGGDDFEDDSKDKKIQAAVNWLKDFH